MCICREKPMRRKCVGGFSLIEIVLTIGVMLTLLTTAIAGFTTYNRKQKAKAAIERYRQVLTEAKANAMSGKKDCVVCGGADFECNGMADDINLIRWMVSLTDSGNKVVIKGVCQGNRYFMERVEDLPARVHRPVAGMGLAYPDIGFQPDGSRANPTTSYNLVSDYPGGMYSVQVLGSGVIN